MSLLHGRGLLPTSLGSADARAMLSQAVREQAVWSARTTHAEYVQGLRDAIGRILAGGTNNDFAQVRLELMQQLQELGYTPDGGFPGDQALGIPPADPGSLRDLASQRRIDLILKTQIALHRNYALRARAMEAGRLARWPAWELVRVETRQVPRGSEASASIGWQRRWLTAGGPILASGKLIAPKGHAVWAALGDSALHADAMDVEVPPFAFGSGMGWREVGAEEAAREGLPVAAAKGNPSAAEDPTEAVPPAPQKSTANLDDPTLAALLARVKSREVQRGTIALRDYVADAIRSGGSDQ